MQQALLKSISRRSTAFVRWVVPSFKKLMNWKQTLMKIVYRKSEPIVMTELRSFRRVLKKLRHLAMKSFNVLGEKRILWPRKLGLGKLIEP